MLQCAVDDITVDSLNVFYIYDAAVTCESIFITRVSVSAAIIVALASC